jgi:hypothetical protein
MLAPIQTEKHYQKSTITNGDFLVGILLGSALSMSNIPMLHKAGISVITANVYAQLENSRTACIYAGEAVAGILAWKFSNNPILRTVIPVSLMLPKLIDANKDYIAKTVINASTKTFEVASNSFSQGLDYLEEFGKATLEVLRDVQEKDYLFQDPF